jgi:hypothetical protein
MSKYSNGKIYKITIPNDERVYIGSTIQTLAERIYFHKREYNRYNLGFKHTLNGKQRSIRATVYDLFDKDLNSATIQLLENYPCDTKYELLKRERYFIENTENCINKHIPTRTQQEYRDTHKEKMREYCKEYYLKNKEKLDKKQNDYSEKNKALILEKHKRLMDCVCGANIRIHGKARHLKSKKHIEYLTENIHN